MSLPQDPFILLSVINTKLRDFYPSLNALCNDLGEDRVTITEKLRAAGFVYDEDSNQFI